MAIQVQEVTLRVVFDDAQFRSAPEAWAWQNALTVGGANVNGSFVVKDVTAKDVEPPNPDDIEQFEER